MKTLNFSVIEILPSLLDRKKTQTIRPAWEIAIGRAFIRNFQAIPKQPRFKVGDKVKLFWKQRSKYKWFCKWCGGALIPNKEDDMSCKECLNTVDRETLNKYEMIFRRGQSLEKAIIFSKLLGTIEITEVFKIKISKGKYLNEDKTYFAVEGIVYEGFTYDKICTPIPYEWTGSEVPDLVKRDGFNSAEKFFQFFDKQYDLSTPKQFYVYRWRWCE